MMKRLITEEGGFTLVELLVTISILAVLFGIVTLTLSGVGANAETTVNDAEEAVVQSAVDIAIADNNIASVTVQANACLNGTEDLDSGSATVLLGDYLRLPDGSSKCEYSWTGGASGGDVSQGACTCP